MNSESLTSVLTRQWRIVAGSKTVNPRNRMPETGASGSVGAPLEESGALPGNGLLPPALRAGLQFGHFGKVRSGKIQDFSLGETFCWSRNFVPCNDFRKWSHYMFRAAR